MRQRLTFLLKTYAWTMLVFVVAKVAFMWCNGDGRAFGVADVVQVVSHGLSLDLSTSLYLLAVPFVATAVSVWTRVPRVVMNVYFLIVSVALSLAFVADTSLYAFWGMKLDASFLQYLETPQGITQSVDGAFMMLRAALLAVAAALIYGGYRACRWPAADRVGRRVGATALMVGLAPLMFVGIRGGLSESTTNVGQVYFSQNQFFNHSAINPVFSFLSSLGHQVGDVGQYVFFDDEQCKALVENVYTTESVGDVQLLGCRRPNVVVVLLESAGEQFAQAMPRLQRLKREGVCFSRCYANSWRTDRGTVCILSGYPSFPSMSVMKMPGKSQTLPSLARTLRGEGYGTTYIYGGDINFTNMRSYLVSTGWETLVSMDDYPLAERHTAKWGVRDDVAFETLFQTVTAGDRFLTGFSTLSSHEPWDVPTRRLDDKVLNAFDYLDECLDNFVSRVRQTPAWDSLLIVVTADHGINHADVDQQTPLQKNHVPMLWIGGAVSHSQTVDAICNQSDLCATLLGQMGIAHDDFAFSRDVLSSAYVYPTAVNNYNNAQWIVDSTGHLLYDIDAQRVTLDQSHDAERLLRVNKAVLQTTIKDIRDR